MANSRFIISTNILAILGSNNGQPVSSRELAELIGWQPSAIRRLIAPLVDAGLVESTAGTKGGMTLAKKANEISLYDILKAVDTLELFDINKFKPTRHCHVGLHLLDILVPMIEDCLAQADKRLKTYKLSQIIKAIP